LGADNKQIEVPITFGIKPDVFNVADPKVIQFLHDVLDEVMALFPSNIIHIGGDEVLYDQWKASAEVNAYMKANNIKSPADLQINFTNGVAKYLEQHNHRMLGWNEILGGIHHDNDSTDAVAQRRLSKSAIIDFWTGDPKIVTGAAIKGYDVVNSYWYFTYLDYDYNTTTLERAYSFNPVPDSLPAQYRDKILGLNTQMWGEWIPTVERMNYLIYPRIAAMAETGWTDSTNKNYQRFFGALTNGYLKTHWERSGITLATEQLYGNK
jgi:hexosaminidase